MNIILIGFSHCGKTTLGQMLAKRLHKKFYDTDKMLIANTDCHNARELYQQIGGDEFRKRETEIVKSLANIVDAIIATGGGAILNPDNQKLLKQCGKIIYLASTPEILWERIKTRGVPAYLDPTNPEKDFLRLYAEREPLYIAAAEKIINTPDKNLAELLETLLKY